MARNRLVWLVCLGILCVLPAGATLETYTTLEAWELAATQSGVTIDFSTLALNPGSSTGELASLIIDQPGITFTFTAPGESLQVSNYDSTTWQWGTGAVLHPFYRSYGELKVNLSTPVTAFATNMMINTGNPGSPGSSMTITVMSGSTTVLTTSALPTFARPTPTFFGVVSTTPGQTFNSILFHPALTEAALDNVMWGAYKAPAADPEPTPELGTGLLSLCGGILLAAGGFRRHLKT